jgi:hypothetical protein
MGGGNLGKDEWMTRIRFRWMALVAFFIFDGTQGATTTQPWRAGAIESENGVFRVEFIAGAGVFAGGWG